jgi:aminoglycoside phosphotransferase (APT) family kinase protein
MNEVVRVGDDVRRRAGEHSATVQRLLRHVRRQGVQCVPEPRGFDELGREVLAFIPGTVPHSMPDWVWSETVLTDVAHALRQWHDASASFDRADAVWSLRVNQTPEVICHNDFAPYNCVFRDGRLVGVIDFDLCAPGSRLWDLAYTAYRYVPLMPPADAQVPDGARERSPFPLREMSARLDTLLHAYAAGEVLRRFSEQSLLQMAAQRLVAIAAWTVRHVAQTGDSTLAEHASMYRAHAAWLHALPDNRLCP